MTVRGCAVAGLGCLLLISDLLRVPALLIASLLRVSTHALLRLVGLLVILRKWRTHSELSLR